tara:strand:+ start:418 stop:1260 length:843 start_codon:yes stop_codon:yes gene_type:complete
MSTTIAFLGPEGTYTDEACYLHAPNKTRIAFPSLQLVAAALENNQVDEAVLPIENSLGGTVIEVVDYLISSKKAHIIGELMLPINHCLITRPGVKLTDIQVVMSKQEALIQCREFLSTELQHAEQVPTASTALAVTDLKDADDRTAAIGPLRAAELAGLPVIADGIQDRKNNVTRFAVLSSSGVISKAADKTSIAFDFDRPDAPGSLFDALRAFADRNINLVKIESRPTGKGIGNYIFLIDFEGHIEDENIQEALKQLRQLTSTLRVFGSYPRAKGLSTR